MRIFAAAAAVLAGATLTFGCNTSSSPPPFPFPAFTHFYTASNAATPAPQIWQFALPLTNTSPATVTMPGNGANNVKSIAFDRFGDMVAVSNPGTGNVYIVAYAPFVTSASTPIATITTGFACCAYVVAVDPSGLVWTCSAGIGACYQYPGPYSGSISPAPSITLSDQLTRPEGLAWNAAGDLFIANESGSGNIIRFNHPVTNGETHSAVLNTGGRLIIGIVMDGAGNLYAASNSNGNILRFNANNQGDGATPDFIDTATGATDIYDLAIDAAGNLYAASHSGPCPTLVFPTVATSFSNSLAPTVTLPPPSGCPEAAAIGP